MNTKLLILTFLFSVPGTTMLWGQCTSCTYTATASGQSFNLNGNETLCIANSISNINIGMNGSGNRICIADGVNWIQDFISLQGNVTLDVYGIIDNAQQSWSNIGINGNDPVTINIYENGQINSNTTGFTSRVIINNEGLFHFTNEGTISNQGNFTFNNLPTGRCIAPNTFNFLLNPGAVFNHQGILELANLENSEGTLHITTQSQMKVSRNFNNHGTFLVDAGADFQLPCEPLPGSAGTTICSFRVGDKGVGQQFINNSECFEVNGTVNFEGVTTTNGIMRITNGDFNIHKAASGTGGHITVVNGVSTIHGSGSYAGTDLTFCDEDTAGNDFDNISNSNSSNMYTIDCSIESACGVVCPSITCKPVTIRIRKM